MERGGDPGYHVPATSPLASMVNRVLTSPYLWWFVPSRPGQKGELAALESIGVFVWL
jgi:hypothetical protein